MKEAPLRVALADGVARVTLARPKVRNAFNTEMIDALRATFDRFNNDDSTRAVLLTGEGPVFCGGADISWMRASLDLTHDENVADARAMSEMFRAIDRCSKPTVAAIHGAALGGGAGLAAVCDIVIAADDAVFGFTEVKLGIIPAVISPFVLAKIGRSHARSLFLTGERFDAQRAAAIGLVHRVVRSSHLDDAVDETLRELFSSSPAATAAAKALIPRVIESSYDATLALTADAIAAQRTSPERQEGLRAFLERRTPTFSR